MAKRTRQVRLKWVVAASLRLSTLDTGSRAHLLSKKLQPSASADEGFGNFFDKPGVLKDDYYKIVRGFGRGQCSSHFPEVPKPPLYLTKIENLHEPSVTRGGALIKYAGRLVARGRRFREGEISPLTDNKGSFLTHRLSTCHVLGVDLDDPRSLYEFPFTGVATTSTPTFEEDTVICRIDSHEQSYSSVNSDGHSPMPLNQYFEWIKAWHDN
ncbi:hypothetical protein BS47DRAFT_1483149 [Hydnum rufescens UP504]|uniref:Uncharacterized protein n=1 Tax=Hydnum rufescens UP504 TaxID=1448309 RepID=A0A9P6B526_9AGAM|nr:hypothetical protein BS47DRAFT_1483149 [Hydnum rufescens UP504]